jgi:hypothetical protein
MRTKTLAIAAALCAASIATSVAQSVYSVNAVGYVNVTLPAGFSMIANPLGAEDNTIPALFAAVPKRTIIYKFDAATGAFVPNIKNAITGNWGDPAMTLVPGEGCFVKIPDGSADVVVTFVGEVSQGTLTTPLPAGFSLVSSQVPQAGTLDDLGFPKEKKDVVYLWNGVAYDTFIANAITCNWGPSVPAVDVAQAFFVKKVATTDWVREFNVNQ